MVVVIVVARCGAVDCRHVHAIAAGGCRRAAASAGAGGEASWDAAHLHMARRLWHPRCLRSGRPGRRCGGAPPRSAIVARRRPSGHGRPRGEGAKRLPGEEDGEREGSFPGRGRKGPGRRGRSGDEAWAGRARNAHHCRCRCRCYITAMSTHVTAMSLTCCCHHAAMPLPCHCADRCSACCQT